MNDYIYIEPFGDDIYRCMTNYKCPFCQNELLGSSFGGNVCDYYCPNKNCLYEYATEIDVYESYVLKFEKKHFIISIDHNLNGNTLSVSVFDEGTCIESYSNVRNFVLDKFDTDNLFLLKKSHDEIFLTIETIMKSFGKAEKMKAFL